jgi:benzylsuccinate CoA-transferase BbsF subunit
MAGPLDGIRVLDFCWVYAGPVMTRILSDLGAEVIKVESRRRLDGTRLGRRPVIPDMPEGEKSADIDIECQPLNHALNRNKRSVTVDLGRPEGRELILDLVKRCDVVANNFAAGVMDRLGLGAEVIRSINPRAITVALSGAGQFGRMRDVAAYANTLGPLSGLGLLIGDEYGLYGATKPTYGDSNAAVRTVGAILLALLERERTSMGQSIDVSEWEASLVGLDEVFLDYQLTGRIAERIGNTSSTAAPHNNYQCAGDDEWVAIAVTSDQQWQALVDEMADENLAADGRFADAAGRLRRRAELDTIVESWTTTRSAAEITARLQARGVAAFPVMSVEDQFADLHFRDREVMVDVVHPIVGAEIVPGGPFRYMSNSTGRSAAVRAPAPLLGEANRYVTCELLGRSQQEYEELIGAGVLE